jgi:hypothetical protein
LILTGVNLLGNKKLFQVSHQYNDFHSREIIGICEITNTYLNRDSNAESAVPSMQSISYKKKLILLGIKNMLFDYLFTKNLVKFFKHS